MVFNWLLFGSYLEKPGGGSSLEVIDGGVDPLLHLLGHGWDRELLAYVVLLPSCDERQLEARRGGLDGGAVEEAPSGFGQNVVDFAKFERNI